MNFDEGIHIPISIEDSEKVFKFYKKAYDDLFEFKSCEKCGHKCERSVGCEPYSTEHWICPNCDSTYCIGE